MKTGIPSLDQAYEILFIAVLLVLAIMVIIAIFAIMLDEGYLVDICIIYAMISFLAVIVLTKVYMGVYREKKGEGENGSN